MENVVIDIAAVPTIEADVVYAVADIHGRVDLLDAMEIVIAGDIGAARPARPVICYLGDYIDRGPTSDQVIDRLSAPASDGLARVFLKGNHEDRMLDFLAAPAEHGTPWLKFGGRETLQSYGVTPPASDDADWGSIASELAGRLPERHRVFLDGMQLAMRWHGYLFVHAGLNPAGPAREQASRDLMWIREPFLSSDTDWGLRVVHGHVIVEEPVFRPNRIGIDTGAYKTGSLTCLVVTEDQLRLLQTPPPVI